MKMTHVLSLAIATAIFSSATYGQGLLDQALGGGETAPKPAEVKPDGNQKPEPAKAESVKPVPPSTDIVSPDAAKKVDEDELLNQLMQPGKKPEASEVAKRLRDMVVRMDDSAKRLVNKDPGEVTQETQRRIVADLDVMIELAKQQQQQSSSSSSQQQQQQPRQPGENMSGQEGPKNGEGGTTAANRESLPRGGFSDPVKGDMRNYDPSTWGGLPSRDRDQVSHGAHEEFLTTYKDMIEKYYQQLAEQGKTRNR